MPSRAEAPAGVNPTFWSLVVGEGLRDKAVVDVGTGTGRVALALAPLCARVVGIDRDPHAIAEAVTRARDAAIANADFVVMDVEREATVDFAPPGDVRVHPDLVVAHLYLSDQLVEAAARSLRTGGGLVFAGLHVDHWRETGRSSRFAYDEDRARRVLDACGFAVEEMSVDRHVRRFASVEEALAGAVGLQEKWRADGRWFRYIEFLERGGRTLTHAYLVAKARRR